MNNIAFRVTIGIAFVTISLLILVNLITIIQTQNAFEKFLTGQKDYGFNTPTPQEVEQHLSLQTEFKQNLYYAISIASIIAFAVSILIGFFVGSYIQQPLRELKEGIVKLRKNKFEYKIDFTGDEDVDPVITEFNSLASELEHIENLRKELVSDVSHELKTPVTSLKGQLEGIKDGILELDEKRINILFNQVERLQDLINKLQEYSSLRGKTRKLNKENINLKDLFIEIHDSLKLEFEKSNMEFNLKVPNDAVVSVDKNMFYRIFYNIFDNSLKYSGGKIITVKADLDENDNSKLKQIIIYDDGKGVPAESLKYLFERFYRVEKSRNRSSGGLGLGLAIVKDIVEAHGFEISAKNRKQGGLKFTIKLGNSL